MPESVKYIRNAWVMMTCVVLQTNLKLNHVDGLTSLMEFLDPKKVRLKVRYQK